MRRLNPKSPHEWQELQEIESFLAGEEPPPRRPKPEAEHH